ncbi:MAG TPA: hypothetical protein VFU72_13105 [Nitrolancea sp.]|nr:hypothetical protein [Nitrolancea sp.]
MSGSRLRWAIFPASVVSAVDNPDAYLLRALGQVLAERGDQATFFEERANPAVRALLRRSGGQALADFRARHPEIDYRTTDPRTGADLVEWLTRTLGTYDIALALAAAPAELVGWLGRLSRTHLRTYLLDTGYEPALDEAAIEAREPGNFTGIFAGSDTIAARYGRFIALARIHHLGPLPEPDDQALDRLRAVAARLVETVALAPDARAADHDAGG